MKNIPVFTGEFGVASLVLDQIPYRREAYIHIRDTENAEAFLKECRDFCYACGAEKIFAAGEKVPLCYSLYTDVFQMTAGREEIPDTDAALWPVQEPELAQWQEIYNERMAYVPAASCMTRTEAKAMLDAGDGYFIHRGETLLGIGRASGSRIAALASVRPGAGRDVLCALAHALTEDTVFVEVASANDPAVRLYQSLGFIKTKEIRKWFRIL